MKKFARIADDTVVEIIEIPNGLVLGDDIFTPDFAASLRECDADVQLGWSYDGAEFSAPLVAIIELPSIKAVIKKSVDMQAEIERLKYITPGNGQAMTYQQKVTEAQAFKAASNPKDSDYPLLASEVSITAETLADVADVVLAAFAQWQQIGAAIESIRLGAKRDIDAAPDEAAARAIVDAIEWPQPAL